MKKEKLLENSLRLLVFVIGIFSICIILLTVKINVNAASSDTDFPYLTNVDDAYFNSYLTETQLNAIIDIWEVDTSKPFVIITIECASTNYHGFLVYDPEIVGNILDPDMTIRNYQFTGSGFINFHLQPQTLRWNGTGSDPMSYYWFGSQTTRVDSFGNWTPYYPVYTNTSVYDSNGNLVFAPDAVGAPVFNTGHAIEPSYDSDAIIDSGLRPNILPSSPQYTTYNITTYQAPSIDTSSVEKLLQSIWDIISYTGQYIITNVGGFFNNIWNNISLAFGYIGDLMSYLFNKVLNTIKQSMYNLFENFRDLFEPVLNSFANLVNIFNTLYDLGLENDVFSVGHLAQVLFVPDQTELNSYLENHLELSVVGHAQETTGVLLSFMDNVIDSDPLYVIHIPRFTFHGVSMGPYEVSFDWYIPIKPTIDTIVSGFLIIGYFYWLFVRISGILHGTAPDSSTASQLMKDFDIRG